MRKIREELLAILEPNNSTPPISYWIKILTFFEQHTNQLNIEDMQIICDESERCRAYYNQERHHMITIYRNGEKIEQPQSEPGLNISKDNVFPKIYDYLENMIQEEKYSEDINWGNKSKNTPVITNNLPIQLPLVASHR